MRAAPRHDGAEAALRSPPWRGLSLLLAVAFGLKLAVALWALDRGFEMGDEGYFLLSLNRPETTPAAFEFYKLLAPFDLRFGVVDARLLRIAAELAGSLALVGGLFAWARRRLLPGDGLRFGALLLFSLQGSLIAVASRSFSYNDMTNLCTYAAAGAFLYGASLSAEPEARGRRALAALAVGFLGGFQFFVKFPPAVLLLALAAVVTLLALRPLPLGERLRLVALQGTGAAGALALFVARNGGPGPLLEKYRVSTRIASLAEYEPLSILGRYLAGEALTYPNLLLLLLVFLGVRRWLRSRAPETATARALAVALVLLAASTWTLHPFFLHPTLLYLSCFLLFGVALLAVLAARSGSPRSRGAVALAPLLVPAALPVVGFAGTNVPFSMRLPTHALPLFACLALLSHALRREPGCRGLHRVLAVAGVAVTTALFVEHHVLEPYGLPQPIYRQTEAVEGLPGLRVDPPTKRFLETTAARMEGAGFRPGDPIVAFDYMPGLVYYLDGRSPGWPFYVFDRPRLNCFNLERSGLRETPFLVLGRPLSEAQRGCIDAFDFPADFRRVARIPFPYEAVYASFDAPGITHLELYAPRERTPAPGRDGGAARRGRAP